MDVNCTACKLRISFLWCGSNKTVLTFYDRHTFILSRVEKQKIWKTVEKLLIDNQVEASSWLQCLNKF